MITIYTRTPNPVRAEFWKHFARKLLGKYSGPDAVADSLVRGLREHSVPFEIDPVRPRFKTVHVLSGIDALRTAIEWKKAGKIERLIAGPALVVDPCEYEEIICSPEIDVILQPAEWVKAYVSSKKPEIAEKIKIWAAGSQVPDQQSDRSGPWIIYSKNFGDEHLAEIESILTRYGQHFKTVRYGTFTRAEFYAYLSKTPAMIYLSRSESQGIALQEAWLRDVPTLVLTSGEMRYKEDSWPDSAINAPYLTPELGAFFEVSQLPDMIGEIKRIRPRDAAVRQFSDKASAAAYLEILNERTD